MKIRVDKVMGAAAVKKVLANEELSKSGKMKELFKGGLEIKAIAEALDVRYNFVYNVVSNMVTVEGIEVDKTKKAGKKEAIIALYLEGKTNKEISAELQTNYNYVYNTLRAYKEAQEDAVAEVAATE